jgi:DNA-binding NarL/FixJ family response regulator
MLFLSVRRVSDRLQGTEPLRSRREYGINVLARSVARQAVDRPSRPCCAFSSRTALLACVRDARPDVALVDIRMPPTHTDEGLRPAREIRSRYPETAVLVLSQHLEPAYALRLVEERPEGVGYLMKERVGRVEHLVDAVQRVAAGECVIDRAVVDELLARRRRVDPMAELTGREREVVALMAEGRSNQGICRALWLSPKTVETHIRGAFAKLGITEAPEDNRRVLAVLAYLRR